MSFVIEGGAMSNGNNWVVGTKAIAAELAVSERTVRNLIRAGGLPVSRLGRSLRLRRSDLADFLRVKHEQKS